ncbi:hypothetical protein Ahy_A01g000305 [Arachis hypogaea]|uniref:Uncharacterized protein n=1 Tax=Arachis hypogaea TaxID=3818 RepID=A0A445EJU5_ARAHY|nr:hypothetical protein Ahy_A01g000305 [Arachis hypogaea]
MKYFKKNFEFDYVASVKWVLRTLEILAANPSDIPPVEWTAFVDHYMDPKTKKQCLQNVRNREKFIVSHASESKSNAKRATQVKKKLERPLCRSEIIVSTLLKKDGSYEKIAEYLPEDQARAATEGIQSKVLAHPDDVIEKVCGLENGKSKCIFGEAICESSSSASQQHVADLERQLQEAKDQVTTLHRFLQQKYGNEVHTFSYSMPHIQSD